MGLFDDLTNERLLQAQPTVRCSVCKLLRDLPENESARLVEVLKNPLVSKSQVARILESNGYVIKPGTLTRHTRGECSNGIE